MYLSFLVGAILASLPAALAGVPGKIYGVNLGSWLVMEPWMLPAEWLAMGGQQCSDCSKCIASEFAYAKAYPDTVDQAFAKHWSTWFTQDDVDQFVNAGINTVRIPLGYWIVEPLVDRKTEFFPRGGIRYLQKGLKMLKDAGIQVILDHHALPGAQAVNQMFAGRCTSVVEFYTPYNYHRALVWSAVMTAISHLDPNFGSVFSIQAVNEPIMDATQTPDYGSFQKNFVRVVRAVELVLGIPSTGSTPLYQRSNSNITMAAMDALSNQSNDLLNDEVRSVLKDAVPMIVKLGLDLGISGVSNLVSESLTGYQREPLVTNFMDVSWQHNNPANPADAKIGPQAYDNHLYYSFGGVADPNEEAYLTHICNLQRVQSDAALGNSPLWFGEWALPTQFSASDEFLFKWADAQKLAYSQGAGWIFWNFKIEISQQAGDTARQWSYCEGLKRGYFTKDPSQYNNPNVCDPYRNKTASVHRKRHSLTH